LDDDDGGGGGGGGGDVLFNMKAGAFRIIKNKL
jgi:hypothetical protein